MNITLIVLIELRKKDTSNQKALFLNLGINIKHTDIETRL